MLPLLFFVRLSWPEIVRASIIPQLTWSKEYLTGLIAVLGTTISPYLFFWQASQEVEEVKNNRAEKALKRAPQQAAAQLGRIRLDTYLGMGLSNLVAFFIILTTAATLHAHGDSQISSSAQAAQALAPLAGRWAAWLFACGIIGTGLLAIPVLAGSAAYALGEACNWRASLENTPKKAPRFYLAIVLATAIGILSKLLSRRSCAGSVLGGGVEWLDRCAIDGSHCPVGSEPKSHGEICDSALLEGSWLDRHASHVRRLCRSMCDVEIALGLPHTVHFQTAVTTALSLMASEDVNQTDH